MIMIITIMMMMIIIINFVNASYTLLKCLSLQTIFHLYFNHLIMICCKLCYYDKMR